MPIYTILWIILYWFFLIISYLFIIKRLKYINQKHIEYTKIENLKLVFNKLSNIILFLFIFLFLFIIFIILKFIYG